MICLREGIYEEPEVIVDKKVDIISYPGENVVFAGTKSINELSDESGEGVWVPFNKLIVNDSNDIETATFYKIKLRSDVEIWQLFHKYSEVINARWPSAQWVDDSVFEQERWGHGYYNYSDVKGTIKEYSNGEIVDIPTNLSLIHI